MHKMRRFAISYTFLVIFHVFLNHGFHFCAARPDDTETKSTVEPDAGSGTKSDVADSTPNIDLKERSGEESAFEKCGVPNKMGLNKYGLEFLSASHSKAGEFPWTVAILRKLNQSARKQTLLYSGAGSLIHPSVVLTAANKHQTAPIDIIRAGEWDFGATNEEYPYQDRTVTDVYVLDKTDPDSAQLIFVSEPYMLTINVRTVCLPLPGTTTSLTDSRDCTTAAWGQQNCSEMKGLHSILGRAEMSTATQRAACEVDWQLYLEDKAFKLKDNQFCTKRKHSISDSCFCDHGAPLFCPTQAADEEPRYEQVGVSIATGGCTKDLPGIFSSMPQQRAAIDEIFAEKGLKSSYYTV